MKLIFILKIATYHAQDMYSFFYCLPVCVVSSQVVKSIPPSIFPASTLFRHLFGGSAGTAYMLEWWMCRIWVSDHVVREHEWRDLFSH